MQFQGKALLTRLKSVPEWWVQLQPGVTTVLKALSWAEPQGYLSTAMLYLLS